MKKISVQKSTTSARRINAKKMFQKCNNFSKTIPHHQNTPQITSVQKSTKPSGFLA